MEEEVFTELFEPSESTNLPDMVSEDSDLEEILSSFADEEYF